MKTTNDDFLKFQKAFLYYADLWGLKDWEFYFQHKDIGDCFAQIRLGVSDSNATVQFNTEISTDDNPFLNPEKHAKHEACHVLIARLDMLARSRYVSEDEIRMENERLVRHLTNILPD